MLRKFLFTLGLAAAVGGWTVTLGAQTTERVSVATGGAQGTGGAIAFVGTSSDDVSVTAFATSQSTVVPADTNGFSDVFVRDHLTGQVTRVSVTSLGNEADFASTNPAVSRTGRFVAFHSSATNLVPLGAARPSQIYLHDRQTHTTVLVSATNNGAPAASGARTRRPAVSDDGRFVAFFAGSADLVPNDTNGTDDVYVRDVVAGTTTRVNVRSDGAQSTSPTGAISSVGISGDGRFVLFRSDAPDLVAGDTNNAQDLFVHDMVTGDTSRVSLGAAGELPTGASAGAISADGRYVAFTTTSQATTADTNLAPDLYVFDRQTSTVVLASATPAGTSGDGGAANFVLSGNGRFVLFDSFATNLVAGDTNGARDVFLRDLVAQTTVRVSATAAGAQLTRSSNVATGGISNDGRWAVFASDADTLVNGDTNGASDLFRKDLQTGATTRFSVASNGGQLYATAVDTTAPAVSADGNYVAFISEMTTLVNGDNNGGPDVFLRDRQTGATTLASVSDTGAQLPPTDLTRISISTDGHFVAFTNSGAWVYDRTTGLSRVASLSMTGRTVPGFNPSLSPGGRYVAFESQSPSIVPGDTNSVTDVFVRDMVGGVSTRVSVATGGAQADADSEMPSVSGNGRFVAFASFATTLVAGDTNGVEDIFVRDVIGGATTRVSVGPGGIEANGASLNPSISADGRYVAFESVASNLVVGDTPVSDIFVYDRQTATTTKITQRAGGGIANGASRQPSISMGGQYVAFNSTANNMVPGDSSPRDTFVFDQLTGTMNRVSITSAGVEGQLPPGVSPGTTLGPSLGADGLHVAFDSGYVNLVPGDTNGIQDVFVRDRVGTPDVPALATSFVTTFGLTGAEATPYADPDGDGLTNLEEAQIGSHPKGIEARYLAEGATGFFKSRLALLNADPAPRTLILHFEREGGLPPYSELITMPPLSRKTIDVNAMSGFTSTAFSSYIEADGNVVLDRQMTWGDASGTYGSTSETGVPGPAHRWFLAEGSTAGDFDLFYLLQNPHPTEASTVVVRYLRPAPNRPFTKTYTVPAASRLTLWVNNEDSRLRSTDVSADIQVTSGPAIVVERAMYRTAQAQRQFEAGHNAAGVTATSLDWFLAEGAATQFFDMFVLLANPNLVDATVDLTYLREGKPPLTKSYTVPASSRRTIWVDLEELPAGSGQHPFGDAGPISVVAHVTNAQPIVVERAMWFPFGPATWNEAHDSAGTTGTGTKWALAEGEVGGPDGTATYILIANTSSVDGTVQVTLVAEDGTTRTVSVAVPANSRKTIGVGEDPLFTSFFSAQDRTNGKRFGAIVESVGATPAQIVVERAMYTTTPAFFGAGTNSVGTKIR